MVADGSVSQPIDCRVPSASDLKMDARRRLDHDERNPGWLIIRFGKAASSFLGRPGRLPTPDVEIHNDQAETRRRFRAASLHAVQLHRDRPDLDRVAAILAEGDPSRDAEEDAAALAGTAIDLQGSAEPRSPLLHAAQPEPRPS